MERTSSVISVMASRHSSLASFKATGSGGMGSWRALFSSKFHPIAPSSTAKVNARSIPIESIEFSWHGEELPVDTGLLTAPCFRRFLVMTGERFLLVGFQSTAFGPFFRGSVRSLYWDKFCSTITASQ